jgi:putative oxidoreductase
MRCKVESVSINVPGTAIMNNPTLTNGAMLIGRVFLALIFILSGFSKIGGYAGTAGYMESAGVPGILLPLVILTELGGGLLILIGFQTRLVALALAGFTLVAALLFHNKLGDQAQFINFMKNVSIAGGFLMLFAAGGGTWSMDGRARV